MLPSNKPPWGLFEEGLFAKVSFKVGAYSRGSYSEVGAYSRIYGTLQIKLKQDSTQKYFSSFLTSLKAVTKSD